MAAKKKAAKTTAKKTPGKSTVKRKSTAKKIGHNKVTDSTSINDGPMKDAFRDAFLRRPT